MKSTSMTILLAAVLVFFSVGTTAASQGTIVNGAAPSFEHLRQVNCGQQALAYLFESSGRHSAARMVRVSLPASEKGASVKDLISLAARHGIRLQAHRLQTSDLDVLPFPTILHIQAKGNHLTGHYLVLESIDGEYAELFDPQQSRRFRQSLADLEGEWNGVALATGMQGNYGTLLSPEESAKIFGGTDGVAQAPAGEGEKGEGDGEGDNPDEGPGGDPDEEPDDPCGEGAPFWFVNKVNFNVVVKDIPLWYTPAIGPKVRIGITYNSQATITGAEPFGSKWQFYYGGYAEEDAATGNVTVVMGSGREDEFTPDGSGGYERPYGKFNDLTKIGADHFEMRTPYDWVYIFQIPSGSGLTKPYLVEKKNPRGQGITMGYDSNGQLVTLTDAQGQVTTLTYTSGKVTRVTDPFGRHADFEYTGDQLTRITDMGGIWADLDYDANADITSIANARGTTQFLIEGGGSVNGAVYPAPGASLGAHRRITITDALGNKEEYYYNGLVGYGWYVSPRNYIDYVDDTTNNSADYVPKTFYYYVDTAKGPREEIGTIVYPAGSSVTYTRDFDTGKIMSKADSYGNVTEYTYNDMGLRTSVTPEIGAVTTYVYDAANDVDLEEIRREGLGSVFMTYNSYHEVTSIVDMGGKQIAPIVYNAEGQVASVTHVHDDHNIVTDYTYYTAGHASEHRLQQVTRAGLTVIQNTYDGIGRIKTTTNATGITLTYDYNDLNQVTQVLYPDSLTVQYAYSDCCPRLVDSITDRAGRTTFYQYDALKRLVEIENPEGGKQTFSYDANGNMVMFTNPNKNPTYFEYDLENRMTKRIWADGREINFEYDNNGRVRRRIDERGIRTYYVYDPVGNLVNVQYSDATPWVTYEYDDYNRLVSMTDGLGEHSYTYRTDSLLQSVDGPWDNDTLTYAYDALGRTTGVTPQAGRAISYAYDDLSRLTSVQADTRTFSYGYTGASPLVDSLTRPEGGRTTYEYNDTLKRLTALINENASSEVVNRFDYAYNDPAHPDQRSSETVTNGPSLSYVADELTTYTHNEVDQMTAVNPGGNLVYDYSGNLIQGFTPEGYSFTASYDAENRMVAIEYTDAASTVHKTEFVYRADSFLGIIKTYENSVLIDDTRIVRNGRIALQDRDSSNQIQRQYAWGVNMGGGIGGLLDMQQSGLNYTYLYDGKGNVSAVLDTAQTVAVAYRYDSFGKRSIQSGTLHQPFQFSTKRYFEGSGQSYFGYRFYASSLGKWSTRDPLREVGGINLYAYVQNNPIISTDPNGLFGVGLAGGGSINLLFFRAAFDVEVRLIHDSTKPISQGWQFGFTVTGSNTMPSEVCENDVFLSGLEFDLGSKILMTNANSFDQLLGKSKSKFGFSGGWGPGVNFEHSEMIDENGIPTGIEEVSFGAFPMPGINYGIEAHAGTINQTEKVTIFKQN